MKNIKNDSVQKRKSFFLNLFKNKETLLSDFENLNYDESGIIDFKKDTIVSLYHREGKFLSLFNENVKYSEFYDYILKNGIYRDDKDIYSQYSTIESIINYFKEHKDENILYLEYQLKLHNHRYHHIAEFIIYGKEYGLGKNQIRYYIYDINNIIIRERFKKSDDFDINDYDEITGLLIKEAFFKKGAILYKEKKIKERCLIALDIEHFKLFNEWYSQEAGNNLLAKIGKTISKYSKMSSYLGGDDFIIVTPFDKAKVVNIYNDIKADISSFNNSFAFLPAFGVTMLKDSNNIIGAYDKAIMALKNAKKDHKYKISYFDNALLEQNDKEYQTLIEIMEAFNKKEFTFYLQPQCRISNKKIVGAEALARWIKPNGKMIPPGNFIPILEKYGFITEFDRYIWEEVCKFISDELKAKHSIVPISINVSHIDIINIDILEFVTELCEKYKVPHKYLKLEITESAYAEDGDVISELVKKLREAEFTVLLDDFGSGYSSLNMLSNIHVDAIKLDALFLKIEGDEMQKGIRILESVINMAKQISLPVIVEGVEDENQSKFLEDLGCRYSQGFYFYRPMPIDKFKEIINKQDVIDEHGFVAKANEQFRMREFLDENVYSDSMLNNILGPVAFYLVNDNQVDITRFNEQFYEIVNEKEQFASRQNDIERWMPEIDRPVFRKMFEDAKEHKATGGVCAVRTAKTDGLLVTFLIRAYYLGTKAEGDLFYASVNNITNITDLQEHMQLIAKYSSDTIIFMKKFNKKWSFHLACHGLRDVTGYELEEFEELLNSHRLVELIDKKSADKIYQISLKYYEEKKHFAIPFTFKCKDGSKIKLHLDANPVADQANNVEYLVTLRRLED